MSTVVSDDTETTKDEGEAAVGRIARVTGPVVDV
jgi:hypothetical protein